MGHTLPLRAIGMAARTAGDDVAVLTAGPLAPLVEPLPVLAVGPSWEELNLENVRRHPGRIGSQPAPLDPTPEDVGDFFARTRLAMAGEDAERVAVEFAPDVIIAESADSLGPFLAAVLGVPWAAHGFGTEVPAPYASAIRAGVVEACSRRGVVPVDRTAYLDPWPARLHSAAWAPPEDQITVDIHEVQRPAASSPASGGAGRPRVLVTFGTTVEAPEALTAVVRSLLEQTDAELVVTRGVLPTIGVQDARVVEVGFTPYAQLLAGVDLVVAAGGAGTTLGAMAAGTPMVFLPFFPDQHWQAQQVAAVGAAEVLDDAAGAGAAARRVLADPRYRVAAAGVADDVVALGAPHQAWATLRTRCGLLP